MKKVLFFVLLLVVLGTVNVSAQVRIGGDGEPNAAAVLDLNADDDATPTGNKGALALPRISLEALSGEDANLNGMAPIAGMLVYNTNTTLGEGVYFWDGSNWVIISGDGIVGNEVTGATAGGGLERAGSGTADDPYTLGIAESGVITAMVSDGAITKTKTALITESTILSFEKWVSTNSSWEATPPEGCNFNNTWYTWTGGHNITCSWYYNNIKCTYIDPPDWLNLYLHLFCLK